MSEVDTSISGSVVRVPGFKGFCLFFLNVFAPGSGTIISSFMGKNGFVQTQFFVGLAQLILSPALIGWLWSLIWGFKIWGSEDKVVVKKVYVEVRDRDTL